MRTRGKTPWTSPGKALLASRLHHGLPCTAKMFAKARIDEGGNAVGGPIPDPCVCGLLDFILDIEFTAIEAGHATAAAG
jgi:hypothetical protein